MENKDLENLIPLKEICLHHQVDLGFIYSLEKTGLIHVLLIDDAYYIESQTLPILERFLHFHFELEINLEGIETINHLLHQIHVLQEEAIVKNNKLLFYESKK